MTTNDGSELIDALIAHLRASQKQLEELLAARNFVPTDLAGSWPSPDVDLGPFFEQLPSILGGLDLTQLRDLLPTPEQLEELVPKPDPNVSWPWPVASLPSPWPPPRREKPVDRPNPEARHRRRTDPMSRPATGLGPIPRRGSAYDDPETTASEAGQERSAAPGRARARPALPGSSAPLRRAPRSGASAETEPVRSDAHAIDDNEEHEHDTRIDPGTEWGWHEHGVRSKDKEPHAHQSLVDDFDELDADLELVPSFREAAMEFNDTPQEPAEELVAEPAEQTEAAIEALTRGERP